MGRRMDLSALDRARTNRANAYAMQQQQLQGQNAHVARLNQLREFESQGLENTKAMPEGPGNMIRDSLAQQKGFDSWGDMVQKINSQMPGAQGPAEPDAPDYYETDYTMFSDNVSKLDPLAKYQGPSDFARAQYGDMERYGLGQEARAASRLRQEAARGAGSARNALAMRGGATGGSLERLGMDANRAATAGIADVYSQGAQGRLGSRLDLASKDWQNQREDALNKAKFDYTRESDIFDKYSQEVGRQNLFNMERYKQQMASFGAGKTADAQKEAAENSGGTWFCTIALSAVGDRQRLQRAIATLRELAEKYEPEAHDFYLQHGNKPATHMQPEDVAFVLEVRDMLEEGRHEEALALYKEKALECFKKFSPEIDVSKFEKGVK